MIPTPFGDPFTEGAVCLAIVLINICADFIHQLLAFDLMAAFLSLDYRERFVPDKANILRIPENVTGSEAVFVRQAR